VSEVPYLNVVPIRAGGTSANTAVVEYLETLLELAKQGEITGLAAVPRYPDNTASYSLVGTVGGYGMVGALQCLVMHLTHLNMSISDE
jgi:hypothetical protein